MAFSPLLSICYKNEGTEVSISDITGIYNVTTNPTGWNNPNPDGDNVLSATILITAPNGVTQTVDVTAEIPNPVTGTFTFADITLTDALDGVYSFYYTLITEEGTFYYKIYKLFLGRVKCCIDKLFAQVPAKMCSDCETEEFINRVLFARALYISLLSMGGCNYVPQITKLLTQIQTLCDFENCNC